MESLHVNWRIRWAFCCLMVCCAGCSTLNLTKLTPWKKNDILRASDKNPAVDVLCIWQQGEGTSVKGLPSRGFAGQILFFTRNNPAPVAVEGDVRVYVFDDQGSAADQAKPIHQFDFPGEVWQTYLRETNIGLGYQLFIPYTRDGHHEARCTLRVRFTPKNGAAIYSESADVTLAGTKKQRQPEVNLQALAEQTLSEIAGREKAARGVDLREVAQNLTDKRNASHTVDSANRLNSTDRLSKSSSRSQIQQVAAEVYADDDEALDYQMADNGSQMQAAFGVGSQSDVDSRMQLLKVELERLSAARKKQTVQKLNQMQMAEDSATNTSYPVKSNSTLHPLANGEWDVEDSVLYREVQVHAPRVHPIEGNPSAE